MRDSEAERLSGTSEWLNGTGVQGSVAPMGLSGDQGNNDSECPHKI